MSEPDLANPSVVEPPPLVSILIPARNAAPWIAEAIESAIHQTYGRIEILVADNASTDETVEIALSFSDPRIRVLQSHTNLGMAGNHNRLARLSGGRYLKYLHADDFLFPSCVESMVSLAMTDARLGLVFAPRQIVSAGSDDAPWIAQFESLHEHFHDLQPANDGRTLAWQVLDAGFGNWIGEPSSVLISRRALTSVGLFNPRLTGLMDIELWVRIALHFDVGFVERPLSSFRLHDQSMGAVTKITSADWLDPLWLAESHVVANRDDPERGRLVHLRNRRLLQALKNQLNRFANGQFDSNLVDYFRYRLRRGAGSPTMHPELD